MRSSHILRSISLPTHHQPSLSSFSSLLSSSQPALLTGLISHWPALDNWTVKNNLGRLRERASGILVPVEWAQKGRGFMDEGEKGKTTMLLETYLDAFILDRIPSEDPTMLPNLTFYLAQHDLFDSIPELLEDIPGPFLEDYLSAGKGEVWQKNIWLGPAGTFTPIHRDPYHNLFAHLSPSPKTIRLYPPTIPTSTLYLAPPPQHQTSRLPVSPPNVSLPDWPLFEEARREERSVVIKKGEAVLIPEGWWHSVEGVGTGEGGEDSERLSVNFWFR
ncbi:hypothetical protein BDY24DRAFT_31535 [Mrakia frigida]|uniref:uncharacterized protein n=1 Tax=Mrakia frigida TaxID=29902 RepID=UPI003FCC058B